MIRWSDILLKLFCMIGGVCASLFLWVLGGDKIPFWLAFVFTCSPFLILMLFKPGEMSLRWVRPLQVFASAYYFLMAASLSVAAFLQGMRSTAWIVCLVGVIVGSIPFITVIWRDVQIRKNKRELFGVLGFYFHQDAFSGGATVDEIVAELKADISPSDLTRWVSMLDQLAALDMSEDDLHHIGCEVDPGLWNMTAKEWLTKISELLRVPGEG